MIIFVDGSVLAADVGLGFIFLAAVRIPPFTVLWHVIARIGSFDTLTARRSSAVAFEFTRATKVARNGDLLRALFGRPRGHFDVIVGRINAVRQGS